MGGKNGAIFISGGTSFSYLSSMYIYLPNSYVKEGKKKKQKQKNRIAYNRSIIKSCLFYLMADASR